MAEKDLTTDTLDDRIARVVSETVRAQVVDTVISELQAINDTLKKLIPLASSIDTSVEIAETALTVNMPLAVKALQAIAGQLSAPPITGIAAELGTPTTHPVTRIKNMLCTLTKKAKGLSSPLAKIAPNAAPSGFNLQDNGDNTITVFGLNAAGNKVDISAVATITETSSDPTAVAVDAPTGMTFGIHAPTSPAPAIGATSVITITATWTDPTTAPAGSPFTITLTGTITGGPATGLGVTLGTPTVH